MSRYTLSIIIHLIIVSTILILTFLLKFQFLSWKLLTKKYNFLLTSYCLSDIITLTISRDSVKLFIIGGQLYEKIINRS